MWSRGRYPQCNFHGVGAVLGGCWRPVLVQRQVRSCSSLIDVPIVQVVDVWFVQFLDKGVDTPVGVQRQGVVVTVQKTAEIPHLQFIDKVVTVPVDNFLLWRLWRWRGVFRREMRHFSRSSRSSGVEREFSEPSMVKSSLPSRAP